MRKVVKLILFFVLTLSLGLGYCAWYYFDELGKALHVLKRVVTNQNSTGAIKVLFIGNSLTFVNMMPVVFAQFVSDGLHKDSKIWQVVHPGLTFKQQWELNEGPRDITENGPWDYVVIQGNSGEAYQNPDRLMTYAHEFVRTIRAMRAKPIIFQTWADKREGKIQQTITTVYDHLGRKLVAYVVPVGEVFFYASGRDTSLNLYAADNHHPSQQGTYLAACLFYICLFGKNPLGLPTKVVFHDARGLRDYTVIDLTPSQAQELQQFAWDYYQVNRAQLTPPAHEPAQTKAHPTLRR